MMSSADERGLSCPENRTRWLKTHQQATSRKFGWKSVTSLRLSSLHLPQPMCPAPPFHISSLFGHFLRLSPHSLVNRLLTNSVLPVIFKDLWVVLNFLWFSDSKHYSQRCKRLKYVAHFKAKCIKKHHKIHKKRQHVFLRNPSRETLDLGLHW